MNSARDARMGVITELIGSIKMLKFFAWEKRWIERVFAARDVELGWLIQARINGIGFLGCACLRTRLFWTERSF